VAEDDSFGIVFLQTAEQGTKGDFLLWGTGVGRFSVGCQTAFVTYADAVLVVAPGMGTDELFVARLVRGAVLGDVPVVAGEPETGIMTGYQVLQREPPVAARSAAVNHNEFNGSHSLHAAGDGSGADNGGQDGDDNLNDGFPSVIFHNLQIY